MSVPNGHVDDSLDDGREPSAQPQRSESDLSDLNDAPPAQTGPQEAHSDDDAIHDMATSEMGPLWYLPPFFLAAFFFMRSMFTGR